MIATIKHRLSALVKPSCLFFVQHIFIPMILRFFNMITSESEDPFKIYFPVIGSEFLFGNQNMLIRNPIVVNIKSATKFCLRIFIDFKMGLGESYVAGEWECSSPKDFLAMLIRHKKACRKNGTKSRKFNFALYILRVSLNYCSSVLNYVQHKMRQNTLRGSAKNIRAHYDLGNNIFQLFLDPSMTYSCALFKDMQTQNKSRNELLFEAQMNKYDMAFEALQLSEKSRVLEIGCGWGSAAIRAAKKYKCSWNCITISKEQYLWACEQVKQADLGANIQVNLADYRHVVGSDCYLFIYLFI